MPAIRVELELADGSFTTRMLHAGETIRQFEQNVARTSPALQALAAANLGVINSFEVSEDRAKGFLATMRDLSIVTGALAVGIGFLTNVQSTWIGDIIRVNSEMERLNFQMRSMSSAADPIKEAADNVEYLRLKAMQMPLTLQSITNGFVKLKATGINPLTGSLEAIADGVAAFGGSDEAFDRSILAISQMSGKGVIQMEELRQQLGESMPRAVELMARSMGISMARLIKDISSGTVQSKAALELFYGELERTYGGRAQYMMQTFEGQLKRTATSVQLLATTGGAGFFEEVKNQLKDLNDFLGSNAASVLADQLGAGLKAVVIAVRDGLNWVIQFRQEIGRVATVIGIAFGMKVAVAGLMSLATALQLTRTQLVAQSLAYEQAAIAQNYFNITVNSGAPIMVSARAAMGAMAVSARALIGTLATIAPWLTIIGIGVYAAAEYFGVFSNKVKDAYENLKQFGAETRNAARAAIDAERQRLQALIRVLDNPGTKGIAEAEARLAAYKAQLAELEATADGMINDAAKREDTRVMQQYRDKLDAKLAIAQGFYDKESIAAQDQFNILEAQASDAGQSTEDIDEARAARLLELRMKLYTDQQAVLRQAINQEEQALRARDATTIQQAQQHLLVLRQMLADNLTELNEVSKQVAGAPTLAKVINDTELYKKGQAALDKLQAEAKGLAAGLGGASVEAAELFELLQKGKYGPADREEVKKLTEAIVEAQKQKDKLDELMKGKKSLENDIEQARIKALEEQMRLEGESRGESLSETEKIRIKIEQGYYAGFGPSSKTRQFLEGVVSAFDAQGLAADQVGQLMRENTFGTQTVNRITTVTNAVMALSNAVFSLSGGLQGVDFSKMQFNGSTFAPVMQNLPAQLSERMTQAMQLFMAKGWSQTAAAGIVGNLTTESGLDPTAYNPDDLGAPAGGIAQHRKERLDALKAYATMLGKSWTDLGVQVDFIHNELMTSEASAGAALRLAATPSQAATTFMRDFERPQSEATGGERAGYAEQAYNLAGGAAPGYKPVAASLQQTLNDLQAQYNKELAETAALETENEGKAKDNALLKQKKDLLAAIEAEKVNVDDLNKNYAATVALISKGKLGDSKDVNDARYKDVLETAKELDRIEQQMNDKKERRGQLDSAQEAFAQRAVDIANRAAEATARITDPLEIKSSAAYRSLRTELDKYVTDVEAYYTKDSQEYADAIAYKTRMLAQFRNMEVGEAAAAFAADAISIRQSLLSSSEQRRQAYDREIAQIDRQVAAFQGSEDAKVEIVRAAEAKKAALRDQYNAQTVPFINQMKQWGDLANNLGQATTGWMDDLADGVVGLIDGTSNLRSIIGDIGKQFASMALKWAFSSISGFGGSKIPGNADGTDNFEGGLSWVNEQGGEIMNLPRGTQIIPHDVSMELARSAGNSHAAREPVAASAFTSNAIQISTQVSVDGSGGTEAQNNDLANRTAAAVEGRVRKIIADEFRKAQKPGNILNKGGK